MATPKIEPLALGYFLFEFLQQSKNRSGLEGDAVKLKNILYNIKTGIPVIAE